MKVVKLLLSLSLPLSLPLSPPVRATPDPVIVIRTAQTSGDYRFPIAPVWSAWWTKSPVDYEMSELTTGTTGDSNIALCGDTYRWILNTGSIYCVELAAGGDPSLSAPTTIAIDGYSYYSGNVTVDTLKPGQCAYGDPTVFAFNTVCCDVWTRVDPDTLSDDGAITAVYGQGARWSFGKRTDLAYNNTTGALTGSVAFLLYGFHSGDRILIQHADINGGTPTWTTVTSKTDMDGIVVASGLSNGNETGVTAYVHQIPGMDFDFRWRFPNNNYTFTNTDDRPQAASTVIPGSHFEGPIASHIFYPHSDPATLLSEAVFLTIHDRVNGLSSPQTTLAYNDLGWAADRHIYLDATSGTDIANCLTALGGGCTSGAPCQTMACGVSQLRRTAGAAVLRLKKGDTYTLTADVASFAGDADDKWITTHGSGSAPIVAGSGFQILQGPVSNLRVGDLVTTTASSQEVFDGLNSTGNCVYYRLNMTGGAQTVFSPCETGATCVDFAVFDSIFTSTSPSITQYSIFAMGGDGSDPLSAYRRAFIGNKTIKNESNDVVVRIRGHEVVYAYGHSEIIADADNAAFNCLKFANDNYPHLGAWVYANYLYRGAGTGTTGSINTIAQSGGTTDYLRVEANFGGTHDGSVVRNFYENNNASSAHVDHVALRNNVMWQVVRGVDLRVGKELLSENNSAYLNRTGTVEFYRVTGGTGYTDLWSINDSVSAPNAGASSRYIQNEGANTTVELNHLHRTNLNYGAFGTAIRCNATNYSVATYESARPGLDLLGGSGGSAIDPKYAAAASKDLRPCTGTDLPVSGCTTSSLIDAGFTLLDVPVAYNDSIRPQNSVYDIGAFETGATFGRCCHCDDAGSCEDSVTEAYCSSIGGTFTASASCSGNCTVGACCTAEEGACSVLTDECCAATQWISGGTCNSCVWQCCTRLGGCSNETAATCAALTNEVFTWGTSCGTCPTVACCTTGTTCVDLTAYACTIEGTSQGTGTDCDPNPCTAPPPSGSCCKANGDCEVLIESACTAITDAVWTASGVCSPNTCAQAGACCLSDETCVFETSALCAGDSGNFTTVGTACNGTICLLGACCTGESCADTIGEDCVSFPWMSSVDCVSTPCDIQACCDGLGGCTDTYSVSCSGTWYPAALCAGSPCAGVGACFFSIDGLPPYTSCQVITSAACATGGGAFQGVGTACGPPQGTLPLLRSGR